MVEVIFCYWNRWTVTCLYSINMNNKLSLEVSETDSHCFLLLFISENSLVSTEQMYDFTAWNLNHFTFYLSSLFLMTCLVSVFLLLNDLIHSDVDFIPFVLISLRISIIGKVDTVLFCFVFFNPSCHSVSFDLRIQSIHI